VRSPGAASLRVPAHHASAATLGGAYPFLAGPTCQAGIYVGTDALTGEAFCFDPWSAYAAGLVTNPNLALAGAIGAGKSALAKSLAVRAVAAGRRAYVPGDPKGEWAVVADRIGGDVLRLGPGLPARINPLDARLSAPVGRDRRSATVAAIAGVLLGAELSAPQRDAVDAAVAATAGDALLGNVVSALVEPDPHAARADGLEADQRAADGREVAHALRRLLRGDLAGMFDRPSTVALDPRAPMVVIDLSALGSDDTAVVVAMTCASAWLEASLVDPASPGPTATGQWVIYDEAWRLLRVPALIRRMQAQWKLSRAYGIANLLVLHRLSDLDAVGAAGSEVRALATGLLADCSTRVIYRQESDQLTATAAALGLTDTERGLLPLLPRGCGLWKLPRSTHLTHHHLHGDEAALCDTDFAMRGIQRERSPQ
jgi:type IV secretory pathway VirB4 component